MREIIAQHGVFSLTQPDKAVVKPSLSTDKQSSQKAIRHAVMMLWITTIFLGFVPAVFVLVKNFDPYVKHNAKQALNLFLSICMYMLCFVAASRYLFDYSPSVSISLLGGVYVMNMLYILLCFFGLVKGSALQDFKLPFVLPLFR